ncbi:hypothetical protein AAF712_008598 [Marasmius tenuissimus]|uniref:Uncharacterized protein n=1 Tax=Marasmius tenuissimus TaxID=585030 RepID=A0ABR2ZUC2_9AGAR
MEFFHIAAFSAVVLARSKARTAPARINSEAANPRHRETTALLGYRANRSLPDDPLPPYTPPADCTPYRAPPTEDMPPAYTALVDMLPTNPYPRSEDAPPTSSLNSPPSEVTPPSSPSSEQPPPSPTPPSTSLANTTSLPLQKNGRVLHLSATKAERGGQ